MKPDRTFFGIGCVAAAVAVALGAFGAHALRDRLGPQILAIYETGVRYHLIHALGLIMVGTVRGPAPRSAGLDAAGWLLCVGIVLFCGSLYLLTLTGARWLGMITPAGGLAFIGGWTFLALWAWRR